MVSTILAALTVLSCTAGPSTDTPGGEDPAPSYSGTIEYYSYPASYAASEYFAASVNGKSAHVFETVEPSVLSFGCEETATVAIKNRKGKIESYDVRPHNKNYKSYMRNGMVILELNPYDRASVTVNGDLDHPIFVFANPLEERPNPADKNIRILKAGTETSGLITLTDGQSLYLEGGAVLKGCVRADNRRNVKVWGPGVIDGREDIADNTRPVLFNYCSGITLNDVTVLNVSSWTVNMFECRDIVTDNMKIIATFNTNVLPQGHQNDGFSIIGSDRMKVTRGFSYAHDDTYSIKTQKWVYSGVVTDVLYEDCISWMRKHGHAFELGTGLGKDLSGVVWRNCYSFNGGGYTNASGSSGVIGDIGICQAAGGNVSNVLYENIYIENSLSRPMFLRIYNAGEGENIGTGIKWSQPGTVRDITFRNIHIDHAAPQPLYIHGYDDAHKIGATFENLIIGGTKVTSSNMKQYFDTQFADITIK